MSEAARPSKGGGPPVQVLAPVPAVPSPARAATRELPRGRLPAVGMRELVAAIHRRREHRRNAATELASGLQRLAASVEQHLARVTEVRQAIEAQGGDLSALKHYDTMMARLRAELRSAERSIADAFSTAAQG